MGCSFILPGVESSIGGSQEWRAPSALLVRIDRADEQIRVAGPLRIHRVIGDDLILGFLYFDQFAELGWFARLAFADDLRCGFEDTDQLFWDMYIAAEDPLFCLQHHLLYSRRNGV